MKYQLTAKCTKCNMYRVEIYQEKPAVNDKINTICGNCGKLQDHIVIEVK